ncbi:XRE family transcriptional regulator [Brucella thiophenivorans]|uniref:Helix-turn-helix family protein n=1 Tax=Brucella thiophenivorans TaxID=571255 RepID=A0A256FVS3_9HYPH|nr:LexA family transcriptional regulator [Brucella thiophenivorans]OYR18923.1 helix-turn-helix family protein [Brucella thiophenivorans]
MKSNLPNRQTHVKRNFAYLAMVNNQKITDFCHMDKSLPNRIREIREAHDMTIEKLAEETGLSVSYISRLESGGRNLSVRNMNLFAHALKVQPQDLLSSPKPKSNVVSIMGRIGAGAEISPDEEQIPPEGLYEIETPFPIPDDAIAFEVAGDSMYPRYDEGDVIICYRQGIAANEVIGWEAAVKTSDGRRFLKRILRGGTPGTFDLESHNAPPIRNVELTWIAAVQSVIRIGQWRKLPKSFGHHELSKMA